MRTRKQCDICGCNYFSKGYSQHRKMCEYKIVFDADYRERTRVRFIFRYFYNKKLNPNDIVVQKKQGVDYTEYCR